MPLKNVNTTCKIFFIILVTLIISSCNKYDTKNGNLTENNNQKNEPDTILYYRNIIKEYPETYKAREALFMIAFIYDDVIKDKAKARESYRLFLEKYPKDRNSSEKMSESARMMLQMLNDTTYNNK